MSNGKGDARRPDQVSDATMDENWRRAFGRKRARPGQAERAARRIGQREMFDHPDDLDWTGPGHVSEGPGHTSSSPT